MTNAQLDFYNSLLKSRDFCMEYALLLATILPVPPLVAILETIIEDIDTEAALGSQDDSGGTDDKKEKRELLTKQILHVSSGVAAYFLSVNNALERKRVDYGLSELQKGRDADLHMIAQQLFNVASANVANLIGVTATDVSALQTMSVDFFEVIDNPKRLIEKGAVHNNNIPDLIDQGREVRNKIDIYLRTIRFSKPDIYEEWQMSMSIDDTGANAPASLTNEGTIAPTSTIEIDYSSIVLSGNTELKLINQSAGVLKYGFSSDGISFVNAVTVNANSMKRLTASSLGYDAMTANMLIIENANPASTAYKLLGFVM